MVDKEQVRTNLARAHYRLEPSITQIFSVLNRPEVEGDVDEPIKLLEVNNDTIAAGIMPLGFDPFPGSQIPFPAIIIEITPEEFEKVKSKELSLPNGWELGPLVPREPTAHGSP